ncbi:hypothetical protein L1887_63126 [Cichorium endivia]|nr:hypothetical protein L1887_63126 [Cichorium endivia]
MVESGSCRLAGGVVTARRKQNQDLADDDQGAAAKSGSKLETRGCNSAMKRHGTRCVAFCSGRIGGQRAGPSLNEEARGGSPEQALPRMTVRRESKRGSGPKRTGSSDARACWSHSSAKALLYPLHLSLLGPQSANLDPDPRISPRWPAPTIVVGFSRVFLLAVDAPFSALSQRAASCSPLPPRLSEGRLACMEGGKARDLGSHSRSRPTAKAYPFPVIRRPCLGPVWPDSDLVGPGLDWPASALPYNQPTPRPGARRRRHRPHRMSPSYSAMTAFSTPFGRLPSMRRRESKNKPVKPIDVDAAQQYVDAGPSSAASTSLLTPRPHHYRSTSPSPATPSASTFGAAAPSSARIVSSPTFVSSSALATSASLYGAELTPPLSPVHPNSAAAAQATKSPLRRALSRTFFFGNANNHSNGASANASPNKCHQRQPASPFVHLGAHPHAPKASGSPSSSSHVASHGSLAQPDSFGFVAPSMTRSYTSAPLIAIHDEEPAINTTRRRSSTLMPCLADARFSRTPSPIPQTTTPTSPRTSLRSIRQMHARKSIQSIFRPWSPLPADAVADADAITPKPAAPIPLPRTSSFRRLSRRASEESFCCRGNAFDGPPAADPRPSVPDVHVLGFYSSSCPSATTDVHGPGSHRMNRFTLASYHQAAAPQARDDDVNDQQLTGLGLVDTLPAAPKVLPKRLSATSQFSSTDSSVSALVPFLIGKLSRVVERLHQQLVLRLPAHPTLLDPPPARVYIAPARIACPAPRRCRRRGKAQATLGHLHLVQLERARPQGGHRGTHGRTGLPPLAQEPHAHAPPPRRRTHALHRARPLHRTRQGARKGARRLQQVAIRRGRSGGGPRRRRLRSFAYSLVHLITHSPPSHHSLASYPQFSFIPRVAAWCGAPCNRIHARNSPRTKTEQDLFCVHVDVARRLSRRCRYPHEEIPVSGRNRLRAG